MLLGSESGCADHGVLSNSYQPGGTSAVNGKSDPLSDRDECLRDAALMQRLGVSDHIPLYWLMESP